MLKCSCGGELQERRTDPRALILALLGPPPRRKLTRRKRKKLLAKYRRKRNRLLLAACLVRPLFRPTYQCAQCGRCEGFYSAIAKNMIVVQPMREAAVPFYMSKPAIQDSEERK